MCGDKMKYHLFIDSNDRLKDNDGNDIGTHQNFYYNIQGFLSDEYEKYYMNVEYVIINHNQANDAVTYVPYNSYTYNVLVNFVKGSNIYDAESFVNIYNGPTKNYDKQPYWKSNTNAVDYSYSLSDPVLYGYKGPKIVIYRPKNIINIKIMNDNDTALVDVDATVIPGVKMLLKFTPFCG